MTLHLDTTLVIVLTFCYAVYSVMLFLKLVEMNKMNNHVTLLVLHLLKTIVVISCVHASIIKGLSITIGGTL